jgi:membrane protein YdbS with pleckstrin-like domain
MFMARPLVIKEGPFVFLRNVFVMEIVAFLFFFAFSFLGNYEEIYESLSVSDIVRYDIFVICVFSLFQLVYLSLLFLDWYFSFFEIHEKDIIKKSGLLFRHRKTVSLSDVVSVETYQSPLSRQIDHATIILEHANGRVTQLKNIPNYLEYVHYIKQHLPSGGKKQGEMVADLVKRKEDQYLEFKETMRYDARNGSSSKDLEKAVIKTIVGFMNAEGGTLIVGVSDTNEVRGIERDFNTLPRKDRDGFENHLNMLIKTMVGLQFSKYVRVVFETIIDAVGAEKELCVITVKESHKPAYLHNGGSHEEFFVRVGNTTQPFSMSEAEEYIKTHWK